MRAHVPDQQQVLCQNNERCIVARTVREQAPLPTGIAPLPPRRIRRDDQKVGIMSESAPVPARTVIARLRRAVFARHSNPLSAWSRWATIPAVMVPFWTRNWVHAGLVTGWFTINALVFPEPRHDRAYATRAMLGEEQWLIDRPRDAALAVNAAASSAGVIAMVGARRHHRKTTIVGTVLQMALTLAYWELMVRRYDRTPAGDTHD